MARRKKTDPEIVQLPDRKVATVTTVGEPGPQMERVMPALFGAAYGLKFARKKADPEADFKVEAVRARWPDAQEKPKDRWTAHWAIPVPEDAEVLPQKVPDIAVNLATWQYGEVAQILHIGPYSEEGPTVQHLHEFIAESGYEIAGPHEEEYLTKPDAREVRTIIRYQVRRRE
jgi:hypothetical protein